MNQRLTSLERAIKSLGEVLNAGLTDAIYRDSAIKRFEYAFELSWKAMAHDLREQGLGDEISGVTRKDLFRIAAREGLIRDPEIWFSFLQMRNLTVHTYDEETAIKVAEGLPLFADEAGYLLDGLAKRSDPTDAP